MENMAALKVATRMVTGAEDVARCCAAARSGLPGRRMTTTRGPLLELVAAPARRPVRRRGGSERRPSMRRWSASFTVVMARGAEDARAILVAAPAFSMGNGRGYTIPIRELGNCSSSH
uniref:Uncharacterized protein n=1 Tax=Setaria viridis TaxID=4556 RepID=A0A4V6D1Y5_SETVI|nr:hypothetical protein SEVIR_9G399500v2 [Setaria viridis]